MEGFTPPLPEDLEAGFEGLEVLALIGRGGMGAVYEARQLDLDRSVALKILPPELAANPEFEERFRREAQVLAKLNHPNVVTIYESGKSQQGHFFILMEFVDGVTLAERLKRKPRLTVEESAAIIASILSALEDAHSHGIIHRDIKPSNILLTEANEVRVVDFGLALIAGPDQSISDLTRTTTTLGTLNYMAPEQKSGHADARSDLYSVGVLYYEMLTGHLPEGVFEPPSKHCPKVGRRTDAFVCTLLQRDPDERPVSAQVCLAGFFSNKRNLLWPIAAVLALVSLIVAGVLHRKQPPADSHLTVTQPTADSHLIITPKDDGVLIRKRTPHRLEYFGREVAVNDGVLVIGAPSGIGQIGKVYDTGSIEILEQSGTQWEPTASFASEKSNLFGTAVATNHGDEVVVGVSGHEGYTGAVSVYKKGSAKAPWKLVQELFPPTEETDQAPPVRESFGWRVALNDTFLVIAGRDSTSPAATLRHTYVYNRIARDSPWRLHQRLSKPISNFGYSVALSKERLVLGANADRRGRGSVHVYALSEDGQFHEEAVFHPPAEIEGNIDFGQAVCFLDDWLFASSHRAAIEGMDHNGLIAAYRLEEGQWKGHGLLPVPKFSGSSYLGVAMVAVKDTLLVSSLASVGVYYHYNRAKGNWEILDYLRAPRDLATHYGYGLAADGQWLAIGVQAYPGGSDYHGAVHLVEPFSGR